MRTTVIIPAYNEEKTVKEVVNQFQMWVQTTDVTIFVVIDPETTDSTAAEAHKRTANVIRSPEHGKGQCLIAGLKLCNTPEVIFCDADVSITPTAVQQLLFPLGKIEGQAIVVPDMPTRLEWQAAEQAFGSSLAGGTRSWQYVSGIRRVRRPLIPPDLWGYLTEVQINRAVFESATPMTRFIRDTGTRSPLRFTPERIADLHAHGKYGKEKGILS